MKQRFFFQLAFVFILSQRIAAQVVLPFDEEHRGLINEHVSVYHTLDTLTGQQAWNAIRSNQLDETPKKVNPGMTSSAYWVVINLTNSSNEEKLYLEVDYAQLDYLHLFQVVDDSVISLYETGDRFPFEQRPVQYRNFAFPHKCSCRRYIYFYLKYRQATFGSKIPIASLFECLFLENVQRGDHLLRVLLRVPGARHPYLTSGRYQIEAFHFSLVRWLCFHVWSPVLC